MGATDNNKKSKEELYWYKDAVIYELHIKAFSDSNGDGIGDFAGLIGKLDYLQSLGITAIWLLPFYPSPLKDDGYDIADYYTVNPSYGNVEDFKTFLDEAHKRGLRVITELVINHTSDQHPWFQRARKAPGGSPERDFYVWTDDPGKFPDVRIIFQDFETSNWTWDAEAKQYYWHRFFHHQPDLNYDNPLVQEEVFKILDYWCAMGVDGFRLDAVPYLFEREGTNGENLPETHAFLKKLRKHVDDHYPGTLLLAEANMWPEDSASYFGDGDECQMNYHFPVMPRIFMSLQMEDRYPITDIFDQTPAIPETCQWAIFLRNHDELTLEMVTDEERDYMYKVYVKDPKARINLGIRHRLAPLMGNDRKKIELLNSLLLSLPGTPVIYYGDEIGMGDNFYLGDRNGVRTPMQWTSGPNAGFSNGNPQMMYLPVILDPEYHYESVNVEMQNRNSSSLLWWTRRMINMRKKYKAFGWGDMKFIQAGNPKVLVFTRTYEEQTILVVVNLSRYVQPVKLELDAYAGFHPTEIFSKNKFPRIVKDEPYFTTLSAYECQWFLLSKEAESDHEQAPVIKLDSWEELMRSPSREQLAGEVFQPYLQRMRWFGGKSRTVQEMKIADAAPVTLSDERVYITLIEVTYQSGLPETYQLHLAFAANEQAKAIIDKHPAAVIGHATVDGQEGILYDALSASAYREGLLKAIAEGKQVSHKRGTIVFSGIDEVGEYVKGEQLTSNVMSMEQSNTSVTYGKKFFFKLYRKVDLAVNPDLEIIHFLSTHTDFKNIPAFAGSVVWQYGNGSIVLGMLQDMVDHNAGDAWGFILDRLKDYNEKVLSLEDTQPAKLEGDLTKPLTYEEIPEDSKNLIDAAVSERASLLGQRTAEMHLALASDDTVPEFRPEPFSLHYQRSLFSSFQSLVRATFDSLQENMSKLPDNIRKEAQELLGRKNEILGVLKKIYRKKLDVVKIRVHGDYHLGQVLFTGKDLVILDFEGEPARSYSARRLKRSPLKDVAGMIRSFHYAAYGSLYLDDQLTDDDRQKLMPSAGRWYHYISGVYMKAYLDTLKGTDSRFVPEDLDDLRVLLQTFILEKAIYELNYELNNRPDWVMIPLLGIREIMESNKL